MRRIDRREFASHAGLAFLTGVTVSITNACGGGGGTSTPTARPPATNPPAPNASDKPGQISDNHGHTAVITAAQVDAAGAINGLDIRGSAGHSHMISLSAAAMTEIKANRGVETVSSNGDGHVHTVTFNASAPDPPTRY